MQKTLKTSRKDERFRVVDVVPGHPLSDRLLELGLQAGECLQVIHEAPLSGDPIVLEINGTRLALRRSEADLVLVEDLDAQAGAKP